MTEKELITKIKQLQNQLKQAEDNLNKIKEAKRYLNVEFHKIKEAKKNARFELSPTQIKNLKAKGWNVD